MFSYIKERIKNILQNEGIIENVLYIFFFSYLYTIFDLLSFMVLSIFIISVTTTLKIELKKFKNKGLIHYLPSPLQNLLTQSSVFDIFAFFWNPNFFLYMKIFYKPFFHNISPEEAVQTLDELPEEAKNVILTKGIVYSLPSLMKQLLLPSSIYKEIYQREEDEKKIKLDLQKLLMLQNCDHREKNCSCNDKNQKENENDWGVVRNNNDKKQRYDDKRSYKSVIEEEDLMNIKEEKESQLYRIGQKSTLNFHKNILENHNQYQADQSNKFRYEQKRINDRVDSIRKLMMEQPLDIKTKVIASSQDVQLKKTVEENKNDFNFEENVHHLFENIKKNFNNSSNDSALGQIKSAFNLLLGVAELKKNTNLLHKIETTRIYKLFIISAVFLLSQYFISKKSRKWVISSTMFAAYIFSFFLTFGTLGIFIYKNFNNEQRTNLSQENDKSTIRKSKRKLTRSSYDDPKYLVDDQEM